jgi:cytochrome c5
MKHASATLLLGALALVACSPKESAAPVASTGAASAASTATADAPATGVTAGAVDSGEAGFNKTCAMCHASGAGGAPRLGDKADWGPRLAQGKEVLYQHALEGFAGAKGMMPPRGGSTMSDAEVKAVVDFMAERAR